MLIQQTGALTVSSNVVRDFAGGGMDLFGMASNFAGGGRRSGRLGPRGEKHTKPIGPAMDSRVPGPDQLELLGRHGGRSEAASGSIDPPLEFLLTPHTARVPTLAVP
jgi:hypothetical protein